MKATYTEYASGMLYQYHGRSFVVEILDSGHIVRTDYKEYFGSKKKHLVDRSEAKISPERASKFFNAVTRVLHSKDKTLEELCDGPSAQIEIGYSLEYKHIEVADAFLCNGKTSIFDIVSDLLDEANLLNRIDEEINFIHSQVARFLSRTLDRHIGETLSLKELFEAEAWEYEGFDHNRIDFDMLGYYLWSEAKDIGFTLDYCERKASCLSFNRPIKISRTNK